MANIKSSEKRAELAKKNNLKNRAIKHELSTYVKKFKKAISEKDIALAEATLKTLTGKFDTAAAKNVIHSNKAQRKIAHYSKMLSDAKAA